MIKAQSRVSAGRRRAWAFRGACLSSLLLWLACGVGGLIARGAGLSSPAGIPLPGLGSTATSTSVVGVTSSFNTSSNGLAARVAEIQVSLAEAVARANSSESTVPAGMPAQDAVLRRGLLQRLVRIYQQQLSDLAELESAKTRRAELAQQAQSWSGFDSPPPHSVVLTDGLREAVQAERMRMVADEQALSALDRLVTENREELARAEAKIRRINEELESAATSSNVGAVAGQRQVEQIRSQVSAAAVALLELEREIRQVNLVASRFHLELLQKQLLVANADVRFSQDDLDKVLASLEKDRVRLQDDLAEAEKRHGAALAALEAARQSLRDSQGRSGSSANPDARASELVSVRTAQWDTAVTAVRVLRLRLEAASIERSLWELRFAAYGSRQVETLRQSQRRLETLSKRVALWKDYFRQKLDTTPSQVALEETRLSNLQPDSALAPLLRDRLTTMRERDQWLLGMYRSSQRLERLLQRWNEDLQRDIANLPFGDRLRNLFSNARSFVANAWAFELFTAEDTITVDGQKISGKRSVTVGKIAGAVFILVVGYWLIGLVSRAGSRFIQKWLKVERNQGELIRRWMRATLMVCLVMFSLVSVKIPLTIFAFAGGALAIGVGFGTQTVLKNVVSGLIILFERPFRVGDVLDVGGQKGTLTSIGLRASVLQLWDGTEALFPNSNLLENALTNWTYSNGVVRFTLSVGVAYGSDTRRVVQLLEEVVGRHGQIESQPKPQIFFTDFGPGALAFEVRFWLDVFKTNPAQVSSDLRHMIAGAFAEHGIVIAFPQHDVHLDSARPLQVEVIAHRPAPRTIPGAAVPPGSELSQNS
jgi:potassium-dependent mechanosensitive channel